MKPEDIEVEEAPHDDSLSKMSNTDLASFILRDMDYAAQFRAIQGLVHRLRRDDAALNEPIRRKEESLKKSWSWQGSDDLIDEYHDSGYQDGVNSMAVVAAFSSFIESLFKHAFIGIRAAHEDGPLREKLHPRWTMKAKEQWDCSCTSQKPNNIVDGILELSEATGLAPYLPIDFRQLLGALFLYRNKMFHYGIEWPTTEREKYQRRVEEAKWPSTWFGRAESGDKPWMFYVTDAFADHCLNVIVELIDGFGAFARKNYER